jgi:hypothetical protein
MEKGGSPYGDYVVCVAHHTTIKPGRNEGGDPSWYRLLYQVLASSQGRNLEDRRI